MSTLLAFKCLVLHSGVACELAAHELARRVQMENMSPEEQKSLSQLYMFLVQNPKHGAVSYSPDLLGHR